MLRRLGPLLRRNVTTMSAKPPTAPLVVVLGSTGTGKSDVSEKLSDQGLLTLYSWRLSLLPD
jgi:Cdc6-like AAA superfamily ATPase